jgi:hypothetical protein
LEEIVRKLGVLLFCGFAALVGAAGPVRADGSTTHQQASNWTQHDTAVYVVSTINVLRTKYGTPMEPVLQKRVGVTRYNVYADQNRSDLYFIKMKRGRLVVGQLAYQMGWVKPMSLCKLMTKLGVQQAPDAVVSAFTSDEKKEIGSFTSTLPE